LIFVFVSDINFEYFMVNDNFSYILGVILRGDKTREEVIETIHEYLRNKAEAIRAGTIPLEKFVITKSLTKSPEAYTDAKNHPHVQVALAMKRKVCCSFFPCQVHNEINFSSIRK
jgi:DNA polymerase elongation subunit (family B)